LAHRPTGCASYGAARRVTSRLSRESSFRSRDNRIARRTMSPGRQLRGRPTRRDRRGSPVPGARRVSGFHRFVGQSAPSSLPDAAPMPRDLNETLIFVKVVEQGSLTAAARSLGLPKTTVSRKLKELENRLGARLLNRTTRRLGLTEAGAVYFEHSRRIASELDEAEQAVHHLEGTPRGWLRITAPYTLSVVTLAPILLE